MKNFRTLIAGVALLALAACESTPTRVLTYGAQGAEIQAKRLVSEVYGTPADPLPYGGPGIDRPLARMKARWAALKPQLERGVLGLSDDGELAIHDAGKLDKLQARQLKRLVRAENNDRDELYRAMTEAVGHNGDAMLKMLPYTEDTFGREWILQAPAGWWVQDAKGRWEQK